MYEELLRFIVAYSCSVPGEIRSSNWHSLGPSERPPEAVQRLPVLAESEALSRAILQPRAPQEFWQVPERFRHGKKHYMREDALRAFG